jgi:uncharacterized membrane protein
MNRALWILQIVFGLYFIAIGVVHFVLPSDLPDQMAWMYELSDSMHIIAGTLEILGGFGLILPSVTRIRPVLTPSAAGGLALLMVAAAIWHAQQGHGSNIPMNMVFAGLMAAVAYGRFRVSPIFSGQ